ncbi:MAG: cytochrome c oxidase subunit II [Gemmatimonadetes bacterium]|nr:MAG: cytochrome c oxidase subunit II [Gemmatimonadota bacterium]
MQEAHSVLGPASPQAAAIAHLAWIFFGVAALVWLAVLGSLTVALLRPHGLGERDVDPQLTRRHRNVVSGALGLSAVALLVLGVVDYSTGRGIETPRAATPDTVRVRLIGRQWWWEIQYEQKTPPYRVTTANELHIPLGRPVVLTLESSDVIHSFWAPSLHGKSDLVPSYSSEFVIQADKPGVYRAPCAEYCGAQHAKMMLLIIAQPADSFAGWYANEMRDAPTPPPNVARGQEVFRTAACPFCHTIRGAATGGSVAPDLTHIASRMTLAAGTLPNRRAELAAWIANAQGPKPGNRMPANLVSGGDLNALVDYLGTLR